MTLQVFLKGTSEDRPQFVSNRFYRPELDVLRFFAFFGVFFFHTALYGPEFFAKHHLPSSLAVFENSLAKAVEYGVYPFFLLSAYLVTELLLREKVHRGTLDITAFYVRRILRIWPLYFAFIALIALVPALNSNHEFSPHYIVPFLLLGGDWSLAAFGFPGTSVVVPCGAFPSRNSSICCGRNRKQVGTASHTLCSRRDDCRRQCHAYQRALAARSSPSSVVQYACPPR